VHIAYLINQYPKVSHTFIRREILALERKGVNVVRIALRGWDGELVDEEDRREREHTRYVLLGGTPVLLWALMRMLLMRPARLMRALALTWRMGRRAERPFPVHLAYLAEACRIVPWLRGAGIRHLHAHFGTNSAEVAMLVETLGGPRWSFTVHGPEEFDKAQLIGLAEKIRRCAFVVAVSSYGRSQLYRLIEHTHWPKVKLVHCGLDPALFLEARSSAPTAKRFVCVGRLCGQKGQLLLLQAAQRLAARAGDFELVFVGDGELRSEIEALIVRANLESKVRITGWVSDKVVRDEVLAGRALVLPSFAEGLPVALMEAMALRRPVISTFVAGIPELVQHGEHGWLVPAGDVEALTCAMQACLDLPTDDLAHMGKATRQRILERHNVDIESTKLVRLFSAAVAEKTAALEV
jgi:glycosyltransferase involved in cell wall biosynthesis